MLLSILIMRLFIHFVHLIFFCISIKLTLSLMILLILSLLIYYYFLIISKSRLFKLHNFHIFITIPLFLYGIQFLESFSPVLDAIQLLGISWLLVIIYLIHWNTEITRLSCFFVCQCYLLSHFGYFSFLFHRHFVVYLNLLLLLKVLLVLLLIVFVLAMGFISRLFLCYISLLRLNLNVLSILI